MTPDEVTEGHIRTGTEKARTAAYTTTQNRLRKQIRAYWSNKYQGDGNTVAKSAAMAILHHEYINACVRAEKAEEDSGIAYVIWDAEKAGFEAWRTLESTKRAEMKLL